MRAEMLMAKMTARGLAITGGGFGGRVELSWTDVAAALGGLGRVQTELMRTMYLDDHRGDDLVLAELRKAIVQLASEGGIKVTQAVVDGLAVLAMFEVVNPLSCSACNGLGHVRLQAGLIRGCAKCASSGFGSRGIREQASIAGMKKDTFNNKYSWLAGRAYLLCARWHADGLRHLQRRMADAA